MKGRDDDSAWADQDEGEKSYASAESKRQRRAEAPGPRVEHTTSWTVALLALLVVLTLAIFLYLHASKRTATRAETSGTAVQASAPPPAQTQPPPGPQAAPAAATATLAQTKDDEAAPTAQISAAQARAAVASPPATQPPSAPLTPPDAPQASGLRAGGTPAVQAPPQAAIEKPPAPPEEAPRIEESIIGARLPLGKLAIEVEDYWLEADPPGEVAYAALSGCISNNSAAAMAMPQVEVTLLDGEQREYKPCKMKLPTNAMLNPLMKARGLWAFQVPAKMPLWCAQFKTKEGKDTQAVRIGVNKRTAENTQLAATDDYKTLSDEMKAFASPRYVLQQQYAKEMARLDQMTSDMDAVQKRLDKLAKPKRTAEAALAAAKTAAERRVDDAKDAEAALKDLEANRPTFIHDEPRWERQVGEARVRLERIARDAAAADKTSKEKLAQRDKVANQEKEEQKQLDALQKKLDSQRKVLQDLEKKLDDLARKTEEQR